MVKQNSVDEKYQTLDELATRHTTADSITPGGVLYPMIKDEEHV